MRRPGTRLQRVIQLRTRIEREGFPRLQMTLLVSLTGGAGFISSYLLLSGGLHAMWLRYPLAIALAYLVFLGLLWLWLRTKASDYIDLAQLPDGSPASSASSCTSSTPEFHGQGGQFGGGGASGNFDATSAADTSFLGEGASPVTDALGAVAEAEELAIPLGLLVIVGAVLLSSGLLVYSAPMLFAELLVDGALSVTLYRRLRTLEQRHWLETAIRRTVWPFVLTALVASAAGWGMEHLAPQAHSLGEVLRSFD